MTRRYRNLNTLSLKLIITLMYTQCLASRVSKIARGPKIKTGSIDTDNDAPTPDVFWSDLSPRLVLVTVNLCTKCEGFAHSTDRKNDPNVHIGVVWSGSVHSRSSVVTAVDRAVT